MRQGAFSTPYGANFLRQGDAHLPHGDALLRHGEALPRHGDTLLRHGEAHPRHGDVPLRHGMARNGGKPLPHAARDSPLAVWGCPRGVESSPHAAWGSSCGPPVDEPGSTTDEPPLRPGEANATRSPVEKEQHPGKGGGTRKPRAPAGAHDFLDGTIRWCSLAALARPLANFLPPSGRKTH